MKNKPMKNKQINKTICPHCKVTCKPNIKINKSKRSECLLLSIYCSACNRYIDNIPKRGEK